MLFNSNFFLYVFLPAFLLLYYASFFGTKHPVAIGNGIILIFSLLFYLCTGGKSIFLLLCVIVCNFACAQVMEAFPAHRRMMLAGGIAANIGVLLYFKYSGFLYENLARIAGVFDADTAKRFLDIALPVGISFYIFQAMSYLFDVYKGMAAQKSLCKFALYISLFPQLVAGPIVRYHSVCSEIDRRSVDIDCIYEGACRFVAGLGKKVLIADILGNAVDSIWALQPASLSAALSWSAAFLYSLQIYYDFSGYSDMAIGLGGMLGFHFPENFILPYISANVTEFWKRWHISLYTILNDYLYIPLGGNRNGVFRTYRNLLVVFLACGLWHGAAWNFVFWGLYHGFFLVLERFLDNRFHFRMKGFAGRAVTWFIVMAGWVLFRAGSLEGALSFYKAMLGAGVLEGYQYFSYSYYIYPRVLAAAAAAFVMAFWPFLRLRERFQNSRVRGFAMVLVLMICMAYMSDASFTPFIYFQF